MKFLDTPSPSSTARLWVWSMVFIRKCLFMSFYTSLLQYAMIHGKMNNNFIFMNPLYHKSEEKQGEISKE